MRVHRQKVEFTPIVIVLESREEATKLFEELTNVDTQHCTAVGSLLADLLGEEINKSELNLDASREKG